MDTNNETTESSSEDAAMNEIYKKPELEYFEEFGHVALIGPTNSGKTTKMKTFLCDEMFRNYSRFVFVGQEKDIPEIAACFSAGNYLNTDSYEDKKMDYFELSKITTAIALCRNRETDERKLLFIDDALIQDNKSTQVLSKFMSQAKNFNTTLVVTMHASTGTNELKNIRTACRYYAFLNTQPQDISTLTKIPLDDKLLLHYTTLARYDKVMIYDKDISTFFSKEYKTFQL